MSSSGLLTPAASSSRLSNPRLAAVRARLTAWRASRYAALMVMAVAVVGGQAIRFAVLDVVAPDVVRGASPFLIQNIAQGTSASQTFEARSNGLERIRLDGVVTGDGRGVLDARVVEIWAPGDERPLRQAEVELSTAADRCCEIRFAPLRDSARRRYRVEILARELAPGQQLSLWALTARDEGGLAINGRTQPANLKFDLGDVAVGPLQGSARVSLAVLMGCFALVDASVAYLLFLLLTSSSPRPS